VPESGRDAGEFTGPKNGFSDNAGPSQDRDDEDGPTQGGSDGIIPPIIVGTGSREDDGPIKKPGPVDERGIDESDFSSTQLPNGAASNCGGVTVLKTTVDVFACDGGADITGTLAGGEPAASS